MSIPRHTWLACLVTFASPGFALGQAPVSQRIDHHIQKGLKESPGPRAGEEEFLRRIYLNLTGVVPSVEDARAFLSDKAADKRAKLVDKLLASEGYARHMTNLYDVLLM